MFYGGPEGGNHHLRPLSHMHAAGVLQQPEVRTLSLVYKALAANPPSQTFSAACKGSSYFQAPSPSWILCLSNYLAGRPTLPPPFTPVSLHLRISFSFDRLWELAVQAKKTLRWRIQHKPYVTSVSTNRRHGGTRENKPTWKVKTKGLQEAPGVLVFQAPKKGPKFLSLKHS